MKRLCISLILAIITAFAVTACSSDKTAGHYKATVMKISDAEFAPEEYFEDGASVRLNSNGHGTLVLGKIESPLTWKLDGGELSIHCENSTSAGTLYNDVIHIEDVLGSGMAMTFVKEGIAVNEDGKVESPDGRLGDFQVTVSGAENFELREDNEEKAAGKTGFRVYYDFTNDSDETVMSGARIDIDAYQDGKRLTVGDAEHDVYEYNNRTIFVRPGCSIRAAQDMNCDPNGGEIEVIFTARYQDQGHVITKTYDPNNLPGAPEGEFKYKAVTDPKWTESLEKEGDLDDIHVKPVKVEKIDDNGESKVRVYAEFTYHGDEAVEKIPSDAVAIYVFQDGVELKFAPPAEKTVSDQIYYEYLPAGQTLTASAVYKLVSDNPVEVELTGVNRKPIYGEKFDLK